MPHIPDSLHADHDPLAIAAYAAGDATGPELDDALALVAGCEACAALHHDLRSIAAALPAIPAPVRPRDFRLTPEQAASIRPAGWRRFLAPLAGPRFAFAGPLGTGLATLGLAGFLVAGSLGAPIAAQAPAGGTSIAAAPAPSAMSEMQAVGSPAASAAPGVRDSLGGHDTMGGGGGVAGTGQAAEGSAAPEAPADGAGGGVLSGDAPMVMQTAETTAPAAPATMPMVLVAAALLVGGVLLGGLRLVARRVA